MFETLLKQVLPGGNWTRILIYGIIVASIFGAGFIEGIDHEVKKQQEINAKALVADTAIIQKRANLTQDIVQPSITKQSKIKEKHQEIKKEIDNYGLTSSGSIIVDNGFVWLFDSSVADTLSPLSSGISSDPSGVRLSEVLQANSTNTAAGRIWQQRAQSCEKWTVEQEKLNNVH